MARTKKEKAKTFSCFCMKCGKPFESKDEMDLDGDGKCPTCKKAVAKIAESVNAMIAQRRKQREEMQASMQLPTGGQGKSGLYFDGGR